MDLEARIRALREAASLRDAAEVAIEGYGPQVLGFFVTFLRDEADAEDAFAQSSSRAQGGDELTGA